MSQDDSYLRQQPLPAYEDEDPQYRTIPDPGTVIPRPPKGPRHILARIGIISLIVLLSFILLIPTLISTDLARQYAVGWINQRITGQIEIRNWSFGWFSGAVIDGVSLLDGDGRHVLDVGRITSSLSWFKAVRGQFDLGDSQVSAVNFDGRINKQGQFNLLDLLKPPAGAESLNLPRISGNLHITGAADTLDDQQFGDVWVFDTLEASLVIGTDDQPVAWNTAVDARLMNWPLGRITWIGNFKPGENGGEVQYPAAQQSISFDNADLSSLSVLLARRHHDVRVQGILNGTVKWQQTQQNQWTISDDLAVTNPTISGSELGDQMIAYDFLNASLRGSIQDNRLALDVPMSAKSSALADPDGLTLHIDVPSNSWPAALAQVPSLLRQISQGVQSAQASLPGADGMVMITGAVHARPATNPSAVPGQ